jgi:hypothetical protein
MISGCMIDGLGRFHEADYRRSWLLLDEVDYIFPLETQGPLVFPEDLDRRQRFRLSRPDVPVDELADLSERDSKDDQFLELVEAIPPRDIEYARLLVWSDAAACGEFGLKLAPEPALAIAYLLNKLVHCARQKGAAPLVGQQYAADLLAWKIAQATNDLSWRRDEVRQHYGYAAFAAGLSLDFLHDSEIVAADVASLARFKTSHRDLFEKNQNAVMEVARKFDGLPNSDAFAAELSKLRHEAADERSRLENLAHQAWTEAGLRIAKRAVGAAVSGLGGGMLLLSAKQAPIAAMAAAVGVIASEVADALSKRASAPPPRMSFLFKAGKHARQNLAR